MDFYEEEKPYQRQIFSMVLCDCGRSREKFHSYEKQKSH